MLTESEPKPQRRIQVYIKPDCGICKVIQKKVEHCIERRGLEIHVEVLDLETAYGAAESDFFNVDALSTVLFLRDNEVVDRYDSPTTDQINTGLKRILEELPPKTREELHY